YGRPLGIPLPVAGVLGFAAILGLSLVGSERAATAVRWLAAAGGLVGAGLILVQATVLGRYCHLCLAADGGAIAVAAFVLAGRSLPCPGPVSTLARLSWVDASAVAIFVPLVVAAAGAGPAPPPWV